MNGSTETASLDSLFEQAKSLGISDRTELIQRLTGTLPALPEFPIVGQDDGEAEIAWNDELQKRLADVDAGRDVCIPFEDALAEIQRARATRCQQ